MPSARAIIENPDGSEFLIPKSQAYELLREETGNWLKVSDKPLVIRPFVAVNYHEERRHLSGQTVNAAQSIRPLTPDDQVRAAFVAAGRPRGGRETERLSCPVCWEHPVKPGDDCPGCHGRGWVARSNWNGKTSARSIRCRPPRNHLSREYREALRQRDLPVIKRGVGRL